MASMTAAAAASDLAPAAADAPQARWGAVYGMALCSFVLVASEFMPVSLLTPIAQTLHLTKGQAGQAISISGVFALITSLSLSCVIGRLDRRLVLLALTSLLIASGAVVAFAPTYFVFMAGRAILGVAIGGFWSMSAAVAMRLVPAHSDARAMAIINGGNALASTLAAPLGSLVGGLIGWRGAFFCIVPVAAAAVVWLAIALPRLPAQPRADGAGMLRLLRRPAIVFGLLGVALLFAGQFCLFTYLRPFLEQVTHVGVTTLSIMLLIVGASGFIGTLLIGRVLEKRLYLALAVVPAAMALVAVALALFGGSTIATAVLLGVWGFTGTAAPVAWWTWIARTAADDAEAGGGLIVAVVQLAITLGATLGGVIFDAAGPRPEFLSSAAILVVAALVAFAVARYQRRSAAA